MSHCQIFYPFDNEDGFISVVCHRERFLDDLLSVGWCKTQEEATSMRDALVQQKAVAIVAPDGPLAQDEPEVVSASTSGSSDKQRKKLSLKK